jgi:hypothetical protein
MAITAAPPLEPSGLGGVSENVHLPDGLAEVSEDEAHDDTAAAAMKTIVAVRKLCARVECRSETEVGVMTFRPPSKGRSDYARERVE